MSFLNALLRRDTLSALSALDDVRLNDLGLNRQDLADARRHGRNASAFLNARRSERLSAWVR